MLVLAKLAQSSAFLSVLASISSSLLALLPLLAVLMLVLLLVRSCLFIYACLFMSPFLSLASLP
jgi:hypothetical protein